MTDALLGRQQQRHKSNREGDMASSTRSASTGGCVAETHELPFSVRCRTAPHRQRTQTDVPAPRALPPLFLDALTRSCGVRTEHATSPMLASSLLHNFTAAHEKDQLFGAHHNAFASTWAGGASLVVCPHHDPSTDAIIRWAIASATRSDAPPTRVYIIAATPRP
jgi:hypothetical protein